MSVTLTQGILIAIWAMISGLDAWLQAFFIFRPIIVCTITGLILGDLQLGVIAGGLTELAFAGLTPAGGTQPPNTVLCGIMTVVIAATNNTNSTSFLPLIAWLILSPHTDIRTTDIGGMENVFP